MTKNLWCGCTITMRSGCSVQQKKYCRDEFLWEEILQESFLRLLSGIPKLRTLKEEGSGPAILPLLYATRPSLCSESRPRNGDGAFPWRQVLCLWRMSAGGMGHSKRTVEYVGRCLASACPHRAFFAGGTVFPAEK